MNTYIAATVYAWMGHGIAFLVLPQSIPFLWRVRSIAFWAISAPILFLLQSPLIVLFTAAAVMLMMMPAGNRDRAAFFLIAMAAVPTYVTETLALPGIQSLINITHYKLAVIILLMPSLFAPPAHSKYRVSFGLADFILLIFIIYVSIRSLYSTSLIAVPSLTNVLRLLFDQLLTLTAPYFLIRYAMRSLDDVVALLKATLIAAVLIASITLVSALKQWDIYQVLAPPSLFTIPEFRSGFLRIQGPTNNASMGLSVVLGLLLIEVLRKQIDIGWFSRYSMRFIFLAAIPMTDSRGTIGVAVIAVTVYIGIMIKSAVMRSLAIVLLLLGAGAGIAWLLQSDFTSMSDGTFTYRQELLQTSYKYLMMYPFFGDYNYLTSGYFDHLVQGQGIIDVTNFYLQIGLQHGLIGVVLFFSIILIPATSLALGIFKELRRQSLVQRRARQLSAAIKKGLSVRPSAVSSLDSDADSMLNWRKAGAAIIATTTGWLFLVATTSNTGLTVELGIILAAFCRVLADLKPETHAVASSRREIGFSQGAAFRNNAAVTRLSTLSGAQSQKSK